MRWIVVLVAYTLCPLTSSAQVAVGADAGGVDPAFAAALFAVQEVPAATPSAMPLISTVDVDAAKDIRRARWRIVAGSMLLATTITGVYFVESSDCGRYGDYDKTATRIVSALFGATGLTLAGAGSFTLSKVPQATRANVRTSVGQRAAIGIGAFLLSSIGLTAIGLTSFSSQGDHYGCIAS